jgi:hypothetical protein
MRALPRETDVPIAKQRFNSELQKIIQGMPDILIQQTEVEDIHAARGRFLAGCIRGATDLLYGSQKPFDQVTKNYESLFDSKDYWSKRPTGSVYSNENFTVVLDKIDIPHVPIYPKECKSYSVCYTIRLYYADPLDSCSG